jgi:protein-disulfide isomerase
VTIVEFTDFQCPFCSRVQPTLERIAKEYPSQVRLLFRHNPLPFHPNAMPAAEAAEAAGAQGKFWEMHDKLFANPAHLERADLDGYAKAVGLDLTKFAAAMDGHAGKPRIEADIALGRTIGVQGTPNFFIDGRPVQGAQPYDVFKRVIDEELATADKLLAAGTPLTKLYAAELAGARAKAAPPAGAGDAAIYRVPLVDAPARGGREPKVTIVEFSDFQCPFCGRVVPTLAELEKQYGADLALVFRHNPLPFHPQAMPAALAAEAARAQGKFWQMHDRLFADQTHLERADLDNNARALGLDMVKFAAALDGNRDKDRIDRDMAAAAKVGARGTPTFFINGRLVRGAQPIDEFKRVIDEEMKRADAALAAGTPRAKLYVTLTKDGKEEAPAPPPPPPQPEDDTRYRADVKGAPARGAKEPLVTIVEWSDFQCPFCARVEPTLTQLLADYPDDVRLVWRDQPLPFHPRALPAALAARAAGAQGKFWQMHDKLFSDREHLERADFVRYAADLGLDAKRFNAALDSDNAKNAVEDDAGAGRKVGARGTPTFFINGKVLVGAQPIEAFRAKIDGELKIAREMVATGTPRANVYAELMKDAVARKPDPDAGPEDDDTVYEVDEGSSPSKGPKRAPLVVVVFSDFQCPFCKRVEPTLARLQTEYAGKLRTVWKNYPLPFHAHAQEAAEAAMAAGAQGKFWQMHDKLFANNEALERSNLESYAQELGLDMTRFKAELDAGAHRDAIQADVAQGEKLGVRGTPAVFINGHKIAGAYPFETFKRVADAELAKRKTGKKKRE